MSLYKEKEAKENKEISLENYVGFVKVGTSQDLVIKARLELQKGNNDEYKKLKNLAPVVSGSCTFPSGKPKVAENISKMNGLIVLDIDEDVSDEKFKAITADKYTHVAHKSFSGTNLCVFVKIDPDKFLDSFHGLAEYFFDNYEVTVDQSGKNKNRLRFMSYDPDIYYNPKSNKFTPKNIKKHKEPKEVTYIYTSEDFDFILQQIEQRNIDLCQEDYFRYVRIGMALASKFGEYGSDKFHFICKFGSKYDYDRAEKDYKGFVRSKPTTCTIGTLYYYCKEAGIQVYSEKTKTIINRVKVSKAQGNPTVNSIVSNLYAANNIEASEEDKQLILALISDTRDYSINANEGTKEIEQMEAFIMDGYSPSLDVITNMTYINGDTVLTDTEVNDIYIKLKKSFKFNIPVNDVRAIINSNSIKKINILEDFLSLNKGKPTGVIEEYAKCIYPQSDYNIWAFKKWIVGALHNWTARKDEKLVCPLTLVLTGQQHGTGKTSFLRNIMPSELNKYIVEAKINGHDKDSMYTLCNSLLVLDDEFGGKAFKDVKEYKAISDINIITRSIV